MFNISLTIRRFMIFMFLLLCIGNIIYFNQDLEIESKRNFKQHSHLFYLPTPKTLQKLSLGYRTLLSDLIWIRGLLYIGEHFNNTLHGGIKWLPKYVDSIITLDPKFRKAYEWGSVLVLYNRFKTYRKEALQSIRFQKKGRKEFPNSYYFSYALGMSYIYEIKLMNRTPSELKKDYQHFCKKNKVPKLKRLPMMKTIRRCLQNIGARYLMEASAKEDAPAHLALLAATILKRTGNNRLVICNHLLDVLWRANPNVRKKIRPKINYYCRGKAFNIIICEEKEFFQKWKKNFNYISPSLFALLNMNQLSPLQESESSFKRKCLKQLQKN